MRTKGLAGRVGTFAICVLAGAMLGSSAMASRGYDLRPDRNADLVQLVERARSRHDGLAARAAELRGQVDSLTTAEQPAAVGPTDQLRMGAASVPVSGTAVQVTLTDAPLDVKPAGVDGDLLVVHQQDIQAVLNAMWAAGAEAATIQGQRVGPTTGVKCVGNTVILDGVPYAPPYVIVAIGDQARLEKGLQDSAYLQAYRKFVDKYGLGWSVTRVGNVDMPAWSSPGELRYAKPK